MIGTEEIIRLLLTALCVAVLYKFVTRFSASGQDEMKARNLSFKGRRLGNFEQVVDIMSTENNGSGNVCAAVSLKSKQSLVHQHVRDAMVLLAKRQPLFRAVINRLENEDRYFEIKKINEVISMIDFSTSDVKASDWQDVWFEYGSKLKVCGLLWKVVILQEEFIEETKDYANTVMFSFNHSIMDGVSGVKFCKQFLKSINEIANGTSHVDQNIPSLNLLPCAHDMSIHGRQWHLFFNFIMAYCGLRPILKFCLERVVARLIDWKPSNSYYEQFPPKLEISNSAAPSRLIAKTFNEEETKKIIQACKDSRSTVTGAVITTAHLAFCQLLDEEKTTTIELAIPINSQRCCNPKPHEDYLGCFVYLIQNFYLQYLNDANVDFWKLAEKTTRRMHEIVDKESYVTEETVISGTIGPRKLVNMLMSEKMLHKFASNFVSSFGAFNFGEPQQPETYKLHECNISLLVHGANGVFGHFMYTINGKMTWHITSNVTVDANHAKIFADICFNKFIEISHQEH